MSSAGEPLPLLARDPRFVAVAKPAGLPVIPARGEPPADCLHRRLEVELAARLWVVHRIDREASGVVLFARDAEAHRALSLAFERRQVHKRYHAWTWGVPDAGAVDLPLHAARRGKARPARPGERGRLAARTDLLVERRFERGGSSFARLEARPSTGRHHQIRVHLRAVGTPILFDPLYGLRVPAAALAGAPAQRLALHASQLAFAHPQSGERVEIAAPWSADLVALDAWLATPPGDREETG